MDTENNIYSSFVYDLWNVISNNDTIYRYSKKRKYDHLNTIADDSLIIYDTESDNDYDVTEFDKIYSEYILDEKCQKKYYKKYKCKCNCKR
jgi:hypothetical protein